MGAMAKLWVVCVMMVILQTRALAESPAALLRLDSEGATLATDSAATEDSDAKLKAAATSSVTEARDGGALTTLVEEDASPPATTQQEDDEALTAATTLLGGEEETLFTLGEEEATGASTSADEDESVTVETESPTGEEEEEVEQAEEEVIVVETVVTTVTLPVHTSRRLPRTVSPGLEASPAHYNEVDGAEEYRGFLSDPPMLSTFMSVASRRPAEQRRSDGSPDIDDIIQGIVDLLGGNVKVTAAEEPNTRLTTFRGGAFSSTRINNRGPPRLTHLPFDMLSTVLPTRIPIRPPITPPAGAQPGRPQFVANTRPPFLAPLPPSLASRVTPVVPKPFATGIPIPIDLLPPDTTSDLPPEVVTTSPDDDVTVESSPVVAPSTKVTPPPPPPSQATPTTPVSSLTTSTSQYSRSSSSSSSPSPSPTLSTPSTSVSPTSSSTSTTPTSSATPSFPSTTPSSTPATPLSPSSLADSNENTGSKDTGAATPEGGEAGDSLTPASDEPEHPSEGESTNITPETIPPREPNTVPTLLEPSMLEPSATTVTSSSEASQPSFSSTVASLTPTVSSTPPRATPPLVAPTRPQPPVVGTFAPRPGMVLDDPGYHPGEVITGPAVPHVLPAAGDVFDVTVSAHHGYGNGPVRRPPVYTPPYGPPLGEALPADPEDPVLITPAGGPDNFVSIDGRKTYFDLFPAATQAQPQQQQQTVGLGVGVVIPDDDIDQTFPVPSAPSAPRPAIPRPPPPARPPAPAPTPPTPPPRKTFTRRPTQPSIRIDTCIVGDDSTCQERLGEVCRTEEEVSSCYCKPGTARRRPRTPCKKMVSLQVSIKVDRVGPQRIVWSGQYSDPASDEFRLLQWEAHHAITNAMSKTRIGSAYLGNAVNSFYSLGGKVIVNATVNLEDQPATRTRSVRQALQRQMIQVIQSHANNIGDSPLGVDGPLNPIPDVSDINECNDITLHNCHATATCINKFGTFTCRCLPGYTDRFTDDPELVGRRCETCSSEHCNKRGECSIKDGQKVCQCRGSYYGSQCEIDGEVLGVAVGASVAAVLIIILTLIFLCMWSRRWKAQDRKTEVLARGAAAAGAGLGGFTVNVQHKGATMGTQYGVSLEDRMRWAQIADTLSKHNIYAHQDGRVGSEGGPSLYTASSSDYLTASHLHSRPFSALNRVTRALSNSTLGAVGGSGLVGRLQRVFGRARTTRARRGKREPTEQPTALTLQQLMALHAQLSVTPEQMQGGGNPPVPPTSSAPTSHIFQHQHSRQMAGPSSGGFPSLGTIGSNNSMHPQQFGLQHLNPMAHLNSLAHQQQQHQHYSKQKAYGSQSTYGQYGPSSLNTMSHDGVSRAPTLGARTPVPLVDVGGATTLGPMGGASVAHTGHEGSEDEVERPYHLPRPKSRISLGDSSDIYYEPDDIQTSISPRGPPSRPPPPLPRTMHPQTYNYPFFH
ncbi:nascent polypeptide-associated complex subunit alpha, muscle-specific form-like isoform X2 [Eriocheir sinensis]|uniref:nascent polypeptide-associated complex subunit alpha, muscle-specific form-like isoform X2 n=1 Tax=Eriocheir sinensis TaxID=95602 RepID=UPI0021C80960|nr:nascent polypeptide-associated complex subunit alpha, muscle-specific form-like isoform X2 [Eriocheir sinensis]